jgi:hypothetical protein
VAIALAGGTGRRRSRRPARVPSAKPTRTLPPGRCHGKNIAQVQLQHVGQIRNIGRDRSRQGVARHGQKKGERNPPPKALSGASPPPAGSGTMTASSRRATSRARSWIVEFRRFRLASSLVQPRPGAEQFGGDRSGQAVVVHQQIVQRWQQTELPRNCVPTSAFLSFTYSAARSTGSPSADGIGARQGRIGQGEELQLGALGEVGQDFAAHHPRIAKSSPATGVQRLEGAPNGEASSGCAPPAECTTRPSASTRPCGPSSVGRVVPVRLLGVRSSDCKQAHQPSQLGGNRPRQTRIVQVELRQGDQVSELGENRPLQQGSLGKAMREGASTGPARSGGSGTGSHVGTETRDCQAYRIRSGGFRSNCSPPRRRRATESAVGARSGSGPKARGLETRVNPACQNIK